VFATCGKILARIFFFPSQKFGKLFIPNKETKEFVTELFFLKREFLYLPFLLFGLEILQKVCQPKKHGSMTTADTTEFFLSNLSFFMAFLKPIQLKSKTPPRRSTNLPWSKSEGLGTNKEKNQLN
jgi:hypothetical protein